ncbi:MAG: Kae1-associated kinase Bud32 [Candidatus Bathyarchaeota archaeon]|nr:Kae1-associated kinase Bud32 [Candidatus Bathyarchaeum tardum]WGM90118.1 MAG: Kae1-associated kinase Bud32 [Candidatus Bathyarchaeum tardum]
MLLIKKGAEASLYKETWHNRQVIMKKRHPKQYRIPELDKMIRSQRTVHEPHIMHKAKEAGVPTPTIFMVDIAEANIVMEFVEGQQIKEVLNNISKQERFNLCKVIGKMIGRLHKNGIIHGDLTTSNMILTPYGKVVFIDFGLSERSTELEPKGVDLHLMKRTLQSSHYKHAKESFKAVMDGYAQSVGHEETKQIIKKIKEIEKRGRYVADRE